MHDDAPAEDSPGAIPYRLRIGVTGHRHLPEDAALAEQVRHALQRARHLVPTSSATPVYLTAVSPLAEGADRLVAREVLATSGAMLQVPLPMAPEAYEEDFASAMSREEFRALLAKADDVLVLPGSGTFAEAYERAGHYVVDHCDVLIALWNGQQAGGRGGTAEIVARARERGRPLVWVRMEAPYPLVDAADPGLPASTFWALDQYNRAPIDPKRVARDSSRYTRDLLSVAGHTDLAEVVRPLAAWAAPYVTRADVLARDERRRFVLYGAAQYLLAAAAIAAGALQSALVPNRPGFAWAEVALLCAMFVTISLGRRSVDQERWVANRALAERLRARLFLAIAGLEAEPSAGTLHHPPDVWVQRAVEEVWRRRPRSDRAEVEPGVLGRLLVTAWIQDQIRYHERSRRSHGRRYRRFATASVAAFVVTLVTALLQALGMLPGAGAGAGGGVSGVLLLVALTIVLPALASALRSIGAQQENLRNAERSGRMVPFLRLVERRLVRAPTLAAVRDIVRDTHDVIHAENREWVGVMRLHELRLDG